jgi:hypothetical protein
VLTRLGVFGFVLWASVVRAAVVVPPDVNPATDMGPAIQAAAACPSGCVVQLQAGVYRIASTVSVPSFVTIQGEGPATLIRVDGNRYGFAFTGSLSSVRALRCEAVSVQTSGGCVNWASAEWNDHVSDLTFGNGLATSLAIAPTTSDKGIYSARHIRWNGVAQHGTPIRIGDGVHHVSDIIVDDVSGTAATPVDVGVWIEIGANTDTIALSGLTLIKGAVGVRMGAAGGPVTGVTITGCPAIESMTSYGLLAYTAQNVRIVNCSLAQNQGGIGTSSGVQGFSVTNSTIHANRSDGVTIWPGSQGVIITGNTIADNGTAGGWSAGISIAGGVSDFTLVNNRIGNGLVGGGLGLQQYCIFLAGGSSNNYSITGNACRNHAAINGNVVVDGGSGRIKIVELNY